MGRAWFAGGACFTPTRRQGRGVDMAPDGPVVASRRSKVFWMRGWGDPRPWDRLLARARVSVTRRSFFARRCPSSLSFMVR